MPIGQFRNQAVENRYSSAVAGCHGNQESLVTQHHPLHLHAPVSRSREQKFGFSFSVLYVDVLERDVLVNSVPAVLIDGSPVPSLLSGGDEAEEGEEEEEGCCEENHGHPAPLSTPDQSQPTTQDQDVAGEDKGKVEEGLSNDVPLTPEEESVEDEDPDDQSVDLLMADWQEDLEAFKQMEKDEL